MENFSSIFNVEDISPKEITALRNERDKLNVSWVKESPTEYRSVNDFSMKSQRSVFLLDSIRYECLFLPYEGSNKLFVSFSGGGRDNKNRYPRFNRWKYLHKIKANILCIDDPMYVGNNLKYVLWYYGTNERSYLTEMVPIVERYMELLGISRNNVFFIGSSGGGYCANYMANIMDGTNAISMNPQFVLKNWGNGAFLKAFDKNFSIDLAKQDVFNRNYFNVTAKNSVFMEIINVRSKEDYEEQFIPFCESNNITPKYGITQHNNILTWLHDSDGYFLHTVFPSDLGCLLATFCIEEYRRSKDISFITNLSYLLNEELNIKSSKEKTIATIQNWKSLLGDFLLQLPSELYHENIFDGPKVKIYFKEFRDCPNIHYEILSKGKQIYSFGFHIDNAPLLAHSPNITNALNNIANETSMSCYTFEKSIVLVNKAKSQNVVLLFSDFLYKSKDKILQTLLENIKKPYVKNVI